MKFETAQSDFLVLLITFFFLQSIFRQNNQYIFSDTIGVLLLNRQEIRKEDKVACRMLFFSNKYLATSQPTFYQIIYIFVQLFHILLLSHCDLQL